jgi:hypothetical protein
LLFIELRNLDLQVFDQPIVLRGGGRMKVTQTWRANDWLMVMMQKTRLCATPGGLFSNALAFKEYFSWKYSRQMLAAMVVTDNKKSLCQGAWKYIEETNISNFLRFAIKAYVRFLVAIPVCLILFVKGANFLRIIEERRASDSRIQVTDGVDRGL